MGKVEEGGGEGEEGGEGCEYMEGKGVRKGGGGKGLTCYHISEPDGCERGDRVVDAHNVIPLILTELYSFSPKL